MNAPGTPVAARRQPLPPARAGQRRDGFLPIEDYAPLGDGRTVALSGADGSIDWWCMPDMDSPPLFDRLLDADEGGRFSIVPTEPFNVERAYRFESNVLETTFATASGRAKLTESLNSGVAGRLPWCELARRIEGLEGEVRFEIEMRPGRRGDTVNPYWTKIGENPVFHVGAVLGMLLTSAEVSGTREDDGFKGDCTVRAGGRIHLALIAGEGEPLAAPSLETIDRRIDLSDREWRDWSARIAFAGARRPAFIRSALSLKLLLYSPSGAIAAAATTSLPERIGGKKNYDYRYAWVRDAGYTIKAFLAAGAQSEAKAALTWLLKRLREDGCRVCYTVGGDPVPSPRDIRLPGYRSSAPVVAGNLATDQRQHGVYGDILETAAAFAAYGGVLDPESGVLLAEMADLCADQWRLPDAGIWELPQEQHYTMSKVSCWQALDRAVALAGQGQIPASNQGRWAGERNRVSDWIARECWSETRQAFVLYPGSDKLDASLALAARFGYDGRERLTKTLDAIDRELRRGPFLYRYSGAEAEEGCFVPCSFWMISGRAMLGQRERAEADLDALMKALDRGVGVLSEMVDPETGAFLGNVPQGLSHLAHLMAIDLLDGEDEPKV